MSELIIHPSAVIGCSSRLGVRYRNLLEGRPSLRGDTEIGKNVWVGEFCIIGEGVVIGEGAIIDHYSQIESGAKIGDQSLITYRAQVCSDTVIGDDCVIGSFIGERTIVGSRSRVFGSVVHHHVDPSRPWDSSESSEDGVHIENDVFVGFGAVISRPVRIGHHAYICSNSTLSQDVPCYSVVSGINNIVHFTEWKGELSRSEFFLK